jgi:hypothetical protein
MLNSAGQFENGGQIPFDNRRILARCSHSGGRIGLQFPDEPMLSTKQKLIERFQSRLMTNAVTQRDFKRPQLISKFVKDIHSAFQVLNLKNDALRRKSDGLKYNVKKVEDICYDLIVRNLIIRNPPGRLAGRTFGVSLKQPVKVCAPVNKTCYSSNFWGTLIGRGFPPLE